MISLINTAVYAGVEGHLVEVETDHKKGIPRFNIVGLPSTTVLESRERIRSAIVNSGYEFPKGKITVNLIPANIRKNGSHLDLPIAIGLLATTLYVDSSKATSYAIIGELALDGKILGVDGVLPMVKRLSKEGIDKIIVPAENYLEASLIENLNIIPCKSIKECVEIINGSFKNGTGNREAEEVHGALDAKNCITRDMTLDFNQIRGQENAKRAITIAVTGGHGLAMIGSPGCGKTMLAKRIPTIMPPMRKDEIIETSIIYSVAGKLNLSESLIMSRPFRSPHSSIGVAGLIGGGKNNPIPGEISLAHNGILFLDEACEFSSRAIESLRIPLEEKEITHIRNGISYKFPCNFGIVMAANPCKCGYFGSKVKMCKCTQRELDAYRQKLSGPIMDRVDMRLEMEAVDYEEISGEKETGLDSKGMYEMVRRGQDFARKSGRNNFNANMTDADISKWCKLGEEENNLMKSAYNKLEMSPRAYKKVLKVARTIADIDESNRIKVEHIAEAIGYRVYSGSSEGTI